MSFLAGSSCLEAWVTPSRERLRQLHLRWAGQADCHATWVYQLPPALDGVADGNSRPIIISLRSKSPLVITETHPERPAARLSSIVEFVSRLFQPRVIAFGRFGVMRRDACPPSGTW